MMIFSGVYELYGKTLVMARQSHEMGTRDSGYKTVGEHVTGGGGAKWQAGARAGRTMQAQARAGSGQAGRRRTGRQSPASVPDASQHSTEECRNEVTTLSVEGPINVNTN